MYMCIDTFLHNQNNLKLFFDLLVDKTNILRNNIIIGIHVLEHFFLSTFYVIFRPFFYIIFTVFFSDPKP